MFERIASIVSLAGQIQREAAAIGEDEARRIAEGAQEPPRKRRWRPKTLEWSEGVCPFDMRRQWQASTPVGDYYVYETGERRDDGNFVYWGELKHSRLGGYSLTICPKAYTASFMWAQSMCQQHFDELILSMIEWEDGHA